MTKRDKGNAIEEQKTVQIADGIYWVGKSGREGSLDCNPYLIIEKDEAVLIDPGSPLDFETVKGNVESLIPLSQIKLIIVHHQDPDLCGSLTLFEQAGIDSPIALHWRTSIMVKYYGVQNDFYHVNENNWQWQFSTGRIITFIPAPYCHFPGAVMSYDSQSKVLFSGDLFGAFIRETGSLYASENYIEGMKTFHEHYMPSHTILKRAMNNLNNFDIGIIAPQHGRVIKENIPLYISTLSHLNCGSLMLDLPDSENIESLNKSTAETILTRLINRLLSLQAEEEVLDLFNSTEFVFKENRVLIGRIDPNDSLNQFVNLVEDKGGKSWISIIEPYLTILLSEFNISPTVVSVISDKFSPSNDINDFGLKDKLINAKESLLIDHLTGLHNEGFYESYINGILSLKDYPDDLGILYIGIDNLININLTHGREAGDEVLRTLSYLLGNMINANRDIHLFKLNNPIFVLVYHSAEKGSLIQEGEKIIKDIRSSDYFIEKLNISIGATCSSQWTPQLSFYNLDKLNKAKLVAAKNSGANSICLHLDSKSPDEILQKRVLLIDPDKSYIEILRGGLKKHGITISQVLDGSQAFDRREGLNPDLIIAEAMAPKTNGFELKERLNSLTGRNDTPFILISVRKDDDYIRRAATLGIVHFLKKPFSLSELEWLIKNLLE